MNQPPPKKSRSILPWILLGGVAALVLYLVLSSVNPPDQAKPLKLNEFIAAAQAGQVRSIVAEDSELTVRLQDTEVEYQVRLSPGTTVEELLRTEGVDLTTIEIEIKKSSTFPVLGTILSFLPLLLIIGVMLYFLRRRAGAGLPGSEITKSGAKLAATRPDVTFNDVAGVDEAKQELAEVVDFLRQPERYHRMGARVPKGILLVGPPGTGKTYLAKAVAGEAGVPFYSISGSQFVELYVGVGAARVRDLFRMAKENAPAIVFIDELDAVGRQRGAGLGGGHDEREQTLNQILVELDGFDASTNVILLAATNRPDILDPALIRPGRFDRQVVLDRPDIRGRLAILHVHVRNKPLDASVDLERLAKQTAGMVGADLANILNEGALLAARRGALTILQSDLEEAIDRVVAGPQRKSHRLAPAEKRRVAVHEAGHALVTHHLPLADPVAKISIIPRGLAAGYTRFEPESDHALRTREELEQMLAGLLGGRSAEQLVLADVSTGAEDDIERATELARHMVMRWGMSEELGPRTFGRKEELVFLGRDLGEQRNYSEAVAQEIDSEVKRLITKAEQSAIAILTAQRAAHQRLVELLLDEETLSGEQLREALGGPRAPAGAAPRNGAGEPPPPTWAH